MTFLEAGGGAGELVDGNSVILEGHVADDCVLRALAVLVLTLVLVEGEALVRMESLTVILL